LILLDDTLYQFHLALDAVQGDSTRCSWEETKDSEMAMREVAGRLPSCDKLADFEQVLRHELPPKETVSKERLNVSFPISVAYNPNKPLRPYDHTMIPMQLVRC
jgi:hypothetical protein